MKSLPGWKYTKESLSVVEEPQMVNIRETRNKDVVSLKNNKLEIRLRMKTEDISFYTLKRRGVVTGERKRIEVYRFQRC